ncbi:MAG: hypothetical protein PHO08_13010 [Methylococcales bacterium]|nr:hypothetical protein [Methylococcales bacterium]MDD5631928.1 hypothetical protein [Methylococcales bacterium]
MQYDGSGKIVAALADLCGLSPKNHNQIAILIKQAKEGLGITGEAKRLTDEVKLAIYQWHYDRLNPIPDVKQNDPVQFDDDDRDGSVYDFKHIHFAVTITHKGQPKRTTVMLEGYLVKALQRKHHLADNTAIRAWIEQAIKDAGDKFDSDEPLTKQVKRLIVESFV